MPLHQTGVPPEIVFFGDKDYLPLFCALTTSGGSRTVYYRGAAAPSAPGCRLVRLETTRMTNRHSACADAFITRQLSRPWLAAIMEAYDRGASVVARERVVMANLATYLDNPVWSALTGPHAYLAEGDDQARCYPQDVSWGAAVRSQDAAAYERLARLLPPGRPAGCSVARRR